MWVPDHCGLMLVRVTWPNGNEREVEVHSQHELDRFVSWHAREGYRVDVRREGERIDLVVLRD